MGEASQFYTRLIKNLDFYYESCEFNPYQVSGTTSHTIRITYMCATSDHAIKSKVCVIK